MTTIEAVLSCHTHGPISALLKSGFISGCDMPAAPCHPADGRKHPPLKLTSALTSVQVSSQVFQVSQVSR
ncbi:ABC transporter G family member 11 [Fusarium oxysporum f. sp. albedinis]|nr:ABC transporter G family member 11 [Fusarium oxysporum f. sp. albedinis]